MVRLARREVLVLAGGAVAAPLLTGCEQDAAARKTYVVGSTTSGVPFTFVDEADQPIGAMIDIVQAVAKDAGLNIRIEIAALTDLIPALSAHKIDLVCAAMLRTPQRELAASFTNPIYTYGGGVLLAAKDPRPCPHLGALAGLTVGAQVGSRFVTQLEEAGVSAIKTYPDLTAVMRAVGSGEIQAGYGAQPIIAYQLRDTPDPRLRLAEDFTSPSREEIGLATRKNDYELIAKLNVSIARLKENEIQAILAQWSLV